MDTFLKKKYCKCLLAVRAKNQNPYGICTKSVYGSRGLKRTKRISCIKSINLKSLSYKQLTAYANEKKIKIRNKGRFLSKKNLIRKIERFKKSKSKKQRLN